MSSRGHGKDFLAPNNLNHQLSGLTKAQLVDMESIISLLMTQNSAGICEHMSGKSADVLETLDPTISPSSSVLAVSYAPCFLASPSGAGSTRKSEPYPLT